MPDDPAPPTPPNILDDVKTFLGLTSDYTVFDRDILININGAFSTLAQLGVGPVDGFTVGGTATLWSSFSDDQSVVNAARMYICMKTRLVFDPPNTGYLVGAYEKQIQELEWRLNMKREHALIPPLWQTPGASGDD